MKLYTKYLTLVLLGAGLALGACSSSSDDPPPPPPVVEPEPTAYEAAKAAIDAATTAEAAQAAYDAVDQTAVSGDEAAKLQAALASRLDMLATADRVAEQKMELTAAAAGVSALDLEGADADAIAAAKTAIAALKAAIAAAVDVDDTSMYQSQVDAAENAVRMAQTGLDTQGRMMAQHTAISNAVTAARSAVNAVNNSSTDAQVSAADNAIADLKAAIDGAADIPEGDSDVASAQGTHDTLASTLAAAKTARTAYLDNKEDDANKAMAATAKKLHAGIAAQNGVQDTVAARNALAAGERATAYNNADVPDSGTTVDTLIMVGIGSATPVALSENKKALVADHYGWEGKMYANPAGGDIYEARVYSNVGEPTQGKKFGSSAANEAYEYTLNNTANADQNIVANTELIVTGVSGYAAHVESSSFDQSAGKKEFKLPPNTHRVSISGMFHGVSGTYYCAPTSGQTCSSSKAAKGYTLENGAWTFKASNNEVRVMSAPDANYASYGWWIMKTENGKTFTASAFTDVKGTVALATGLETLQGKATYTGGAAGKYALKSSTGGTNDAGHFTARAMLEADFTANMISGTIDNFTGADDMSRDWSVKLGKTALTANGMFNSGGNSDNEVAGDDVTWTIGGTAGAEAGSWTGALRDTASTAADTSGVPKVGTGTFYTTYGDDGKMVGGFGVTK